MNQYILFNYFLETVFLSIFVSFYYKFKYKPIMIAGLSVLTIIILNLLQLNVVSTKLIILLLAFLLILFKEKKMTLNHFIVLLVYFIVINICELLSVYIVMMNRSIPISLYKVNSTIYKDIIMYSRLLQIILTILLYQLKRINITSLLKKWWYAVIFEILMISTIIISLITFKDEIYHSALLQSIQVLLFGLNILFLVFTYYFYQNNKKKIEHEKELLKYSSRVQNYATMNHIKKETDYLNHQMFYILWQVESHLEKGDINKAQEIITKYKDIIRKNKVIIHTENDIFDKYMSLYLSKSNDLDIHLTYSINIDKNDFYDDIQFINALTQLFELMFLEHSTIDLNIQEINHFLVFKITIKKDYLFDLNQIDNQLNTIFSKFNPKTNITESDNELTIKISCLIPN